jgi:Putative auto-transporter adhesin, head GIN domain
MTLLRSVEGDEMQRLISFALLTVSLVFAFSGCRHFGKGIKGSGTIKTEKRELGAFSSVEIIGAYEIRITCQQPQSLEIEGDDNILPIIRTEVHDGVLRISNEKDYQGTSPLVVRIKVPDLQRVASMGAGDIRIAKLKNEKLDVQSTGAARIEAEGETKFVGISSTGAGKVEFYDLHAERAKVTVTGAAKVDVYASQQLDTTVSGVGQVTYDGNPGVVNKSVSGIGRVSQRESGGS